jgi:hypothetical protein
VPICVKAVAFTARVLAQVGVDELLNLLHQGVYDIHLIGTGMVCVVFLVGRIERW